MNTYACVRTRGPSPVFGILVLLPGASVSPAPGLRYGKGYEQFDKPSKTN